MKLKFDKYSLNQLMTYPNKKTLQQIISKMNSSTKKFIKN